MNVTACPTATVTDLGLTPADVMVIVAPLGAGAAVADDHGHAAWRARRAAAALEENDENDWNDQDEERERRERGNACLSHS